MKNSKFFLAVIAGTVVMFLLGWVIYGMALKGFMEEHSGLSKEAAKMVFKTMDGNPTPMMLAFIALSNLFTALLLTLVCGWGNIMSFGSGIKTGAIVGLLLALSVDLIFYAMSNLYTPESIAVDVGAYTVMSAIMTGVIALILGKGKTAR